MRKFIFFIILLVLMNFFHNCEKKEANNTVTSHSGNQPILVLTDSAGSNVFNGYVTEILDTEGILCYQVVDINHTHISLSYLNNFDMIILADTSPLSAGITTALSSYVDNGGSIIGLSPDVRLAAVFGLISMETSTCEQYIKVDTTTTIGNGVTGISMQFHGEADDYRLDSAQAVAFIYSDADTPTSKPAVALNNYGKGCSVCFTYDLAKSTILFRQGQYKYRSNGDNDDPDGDVIYRQNDLLYNYLDENKANIPQADEQQDILVNAINYLAGFNKPLPRLWYYPDGAMTIAWITGDGDDSTEEQILMYAGKVKEYGGYFTLFEGAGNEFNDELDNRLLADGHSTAKHINLGCRKPPLKGAEAGITRQIQAFIAEYGHQPLTDREHCLNWVGWTEHAKYLSANGIRINSNATLFIENSGGKAYLNASGLPMKYMDEYGNIVDLYQQSTTFYEKNDSTVVNESLNNFHSVLTYSFHPVYAGTRLSWVETAASYSQSKGIPMVSGDYWANFVDSRREMKFQNVKLSATGTTVTFDVHQGSRAIKNATVMIPECRDSLSVVQVEEEGKEKKYSTRLIDGVQYALFIVSLEAGQTKSYVVTYDFITRAGTGE